MQGLKITGPILLAFGDEFKKDDYVFVRTSDYRVKGIITYVDGTYNGIIVRDKDNDSICYFIDLVQIEDLYHLF